MLVERRARAERRGRGRPCGRSVRGHRPGRGRGGRSAHREGQRLRRRGPQRGRSRSTSRRSMADMSGFPGFIEVQIEGDEVVDLRRDHRAVGVASRRHGRRHEPSGPDVPVLDACPEPDGVQGHPGRPARGSSRPSPTSNRTRTAPIAARRPIGFSRTGGSTIDVIADDATCRSVGADPGSGQRTADDVQQGRQNSFALPDPLRNLAGADQAATRRRRCVRERSTSAAPARPEELPRAATRPPSELRSAFRARSPATGGPYSGPRGSCIPGLYPGGHRSDDQGRSRT